jgi:hypothetical protein
MKYRKKPIEVEAVQWFENGDHPDVGHYRRGASDDKYRCGQCKRPFRDHGWIGTFVGGRRVCPGDWIITGVKGDVVRCKPDIFEATHDPVEGTLVPSTAGRLT